MGVEFDISELKDFRDNLKNLILKAPDFYEKMTKEITARLLAKVIKRTPVGVYNKPVSFVTKDGKKVSFTPKTGKVGGTLRRGWTNNSNMNAVSFVGSISVTRTGDAYSIVVKNNVRYAPYVEYGHRTRNGGWVEGRFMLTLSEEEIRQSSPSLIQKRINAFLKEVF